MIARNRWLLAAACLVAACAPAAAPEPLPDDGFVTVRGASLAYRVFGSGPGVPAVFVHGGPGSTGCPFEMALGTILHDRPVIVYDQIGSGYSSRIPEERLPDFVDFERFLEEIDALREELDLTELHLVGSSWGSAVSLEYLLEGNPEGVRSVSFVGPFFGTERWISDTDRLVATLSDSAQRAIEEALASGDYTAPAFAAANTEFSALYGVRTPADEVEWGSCDWEPRGDSGLYEYMWGPTEFVSTGTLRDYDRVARLQELGLPALFVRGEFDTPSPETVAEYSSMVPGSSVETIPDAGHMVFVDQPEAFDDVVARFLRSVDGR